MNENNSKNVVQFHYSIKFYNEDGSYIDKDGFTIEVTEGRTQESAEETGDMAFDLSEEKSEKLMIMYDAFEYEKTLEDVT